MMSPISAGPSHTHCPRPGPRPLVPLLESANSGSSPGTAVQGPLPTRPSGASTLPSGASILPRARSPRSAACNRPAAASVERTGGWPTAAGLGATGDPGTAPPPALSQREVSPRPPTDGPGAGEGRGAGLTQRQQRVAQQRGGRAALMVAHEGGVFAAQPAGQQVLHREPGRVELGGREHEAHGQHQVGQREGDLGAVHRAAAAAQTRGEAPPTPRHWKGRASRSVGAGRRGVVWEMESTTTARGALGDGVTAGPRARPEAVNCPQSSRGLGSSRSAGGRRCA